jgi:hypothetical protein
MLDLMAGQQDIKMDVLAEQQYNMYNTDTTPASSLTSSLRMMGAYVDGRPTPASSNAFTMLASVYRGGGLVKCCHG